MTVIYYITVVIGKLTKSVEFRRIRVIFKEKHDCRENDRFVPIIIIRVKFFLKIFSRTRETTSIVIKCLFVHFACNVKTMCREMRKRNLL